MNLAAVGLVARKDLLLHLRTKRLLIIGGLMALVLVLLTIVVPVAFLGDIQEELSTAPNEDGTEGIGTSWQNVALLFFFSGVFILSGLFYLQLLPIVLTADAVCSEWSNQHVFLLLSKPLTRTEFVVGKFVGALVAVLGLAVPLLLLDYLILQLVLPGFSDGNDWLRFAGAVGFVILGSAAWAAFALLMSTLTRSTAQAMVLTLAAWILLFPLLANLDLFVGLIRHGGEVFAMTNAEAGRGWSQYFSPANNMAAARGLLAPKDSGFITFLVSGLGGVQAGWAAFWLTVQTALFGGLAVWRVQRRDFA